MPLKPVLIQKFATEGQSTVRLEQVRLDKTEFDEDWLQEPIQ